MSQPDTKPYRRGPMHNKRYHHRVLTPDEGVIMCSTEEDAQRVMDLLNAYHEQLTRLRAALDQRSHA